MIAAHNNPWQISYEDWIKGIVQSDVPANFIDSNFPNEEIKEKFLKDIEKYDDAFCKSILRKFLIKTGHMPTNDEFATQALFANLKAEKEKTIERMKEIPYLGKLFYNAKTKENIPTWDGVDWVIQLLPHNPQMAVDVIFAYLVAHFWFLPDGRIHGMFDSMALIRRKYFDQEHPSQLLLDLTPRQFEQLTCYLYRKLGYKATLTKNGADQGIDVIAIKKSHGGTDKLLIQCKRWISNVGQPIVRDLNGTVASDKATKGIIVTTGGFTKKAIEFQKKNSNTIELIPLESFVKLLNRYCGTDWPTYLDQYLLSVEKERTNDEVEE